MEERGEDVEEEVVGDEREDAPDHQAFPRHRCTKTHEETEAQSDGKVVRVVCLSDTHWLHEQIKIADGDILIHCGDFSTRGPLTQVKAFNEWLGTLPHRHKIVIAGNHEMALDDLKHEPQAIKDIFTNAIYIQDEEINIEGLRIYGSPWIARNKFFLVPSFRWALSKGIGSMGLGFAMSSKSPDLYQKWNNIPEDLDFLVTHMPPYQILDSYLQKNLGCPYLRATVVERAKPKVHMFGRGSLFSHGTWFINAANALPPYRSSVFDYDVQARAVITMYDAGGTPLTPPPSPTQPRQHIPPRRGASAPLERKRAKEAVSVTRY